MWLGMPALALGDARPLQERDTAASEFTQCRTLGTGADPDAKHGLRSSKVTKQHKVGASLLGSFGLSSVCLIRIRTVHCW